MPRPIAVIVDWYSAGEDTPMNLHYSGAVIAILGTALLPACQHIPEQPLRVDERMQTLERREIAVEPVTDYARALAKTQGHDQATFNAEDGLDLSEAEAVALWYNAALRIARLEIDRSAALAAVAGRWDDPTLEAGVGRRRENLDNGPAYENDNSLQPDVKRTWIHSAGLSVTIPLSGRLSAKRHARALAHDAAALGATQAEWETLAQLRGAWYDWSTVVARRELIETHLDVVDQFTGVSKALSQAGEMAPANARLFLIEKLRKEAQLEGVLAKERALRAEILRILGLVPDAPLNLIPSVDVAGPDLELASDPILARRHPSVRHLEGRYAVAEAELRAELRKQYPDITISPGFLEDGPETSLTLGFGFPLPVWNANREGIADAYAKRELARARLDGTLLAVRSKLATARDSHRAASARRQALVEKAAPVVDEQMTESQALLRMGEAEPTLLFQALIQAYELKEEILQATLDEARARGTLRAYAGLDSPPADKEQAP